MSGEENGDTYAPTIVVGRLPLGIAGGGEKGHEVPFVESADQVSSSSSLSSDRASMDTDGSGDAFRVSAQGVVYDGVLRSDVGAAVVSDLLPGIGVGGVEPKIEEEGFPGTDTGVIAVIDGAGKVSDDETGKVNLGIGLPFAMERPEAAAAADISNITGEEVVEAKTEPVESSTPSSNNPPGEEIAAASEGREIWMNGFEVGDMVWGKVKSHPWWPGHIFDETIATSSVRKTSREGHVLVAFFGDSSYGWFDPAELVSFEPHYAEKSKQTTSKNFTKAVEEAIDEASRRSAISVTCHCHNPLNIRPTSVPGYVSVDVAGYEPGGIYSLKRIAKAREGFAPARALSFLRQAAETPLDPELWSIEGIKQAAILLATRRAIFEEFDRTYAEAFGGHASRNTLDLKGSLEQPGRVQSRAAPLSGPMVFAESLGERQETTAAAAAAVPSTTAAVAPAVKKNKHLLKRREEPHGFGGGADAVIQKKPPPAEDQTLPAAVDEKAAALAAAALAEAHQRMMVSTTTDGGAAAVKKKKRKREPGPGPPPPSPKKIVREPSADGGGGVSALLESPAAAAAGQLPPVLDLAALDVELPTALTGLTALAVDPFHGADRSMASTIRRVFLLFRSLVFEKGLPFPPPRAYGPFLLRAARLPPDGAAGGAQQKAALPVNLRKAAPPASRAVDPTKAGRKRMIPSDRSEDKLSKKPKKALPLPEKKISKHAKAEPPAPVKKQEMAPAPVKKQEAAAAAAPAPPKKQEAAPGKPKAAAPTFMVMKFPQRTTLPSISSLKAKFARFGPLDLSGTRVFWKSYTCKVLFRHKADAQAALDYAQSNEVFGQVKVSYSLRDPDLPAADGGSGELPKRPDLTAPPKFSGQLKSILKKPPEEGGAAVIAKETQRVKFLLGGGDGTGEPPVVVCSAASLENSIRKNSASIKSVSFQQQLDPRGGKPAAVAAAPLPLPPPPPGEVESRDIDFSRQMLSLLTRCCDIVADVKSALGYVPYHPL